MEEVKPILGGRFSNAYDSGTETVKFEGDWAAFRADSSDPLDWFTIITNVNVAVTDGSRGNHNSYLDNLYVDTTGKNLTDPTGGGVPPVEESKLINISTRGSVAPGNGVMIGGFYISGTEAMEVLIQGVGPELVSAASGLTAADVLADPKISLYDGDINLVTENDDWGDDAAIAQAQIDAGSYALAAGSKSSAILMTLEPGLYTVIVTGVSDGEGVALVEAYEVPE